MTANHDPPAPQQPSDQHRKSLRRLGRDTLLYAIAMLFSRLVSFIMLPIYTRYLTPADYGLLSILELSGEIAMLLFSAGATAGLMRFYFKSNDPQERDRVLFTAWATATALYLAGSVLLLAAAPLIWKNVLGGAGTLTMVRLMAINFTLGSLMLVPMQMLSIDQRPLASSLVLSVKLVIQLGLNILFVVGFRSGPVGILWSSFISALFVGLIMTGVLLRRTGLAWHWPLFWELRRFSLPIQISSAGTFILTYGDRFLLKRFHDLATVGIYGLAYQFGFLAFVVVGSPFFKAWIPQRFQLVHDDRTTRDARYNRGFLYGDLAVVAAAVGISLFIRPILFLMTTTQFHSAATLVPVLVLAYVFQVWNQVADFGIEVSGKTRYTSISTWTSVAVIAVLYLVLIPPFAGMGAAVATLIAMMVRFGTTLFFAQRLWPVAYEWRPHVLMVLGGVTVTLGALLVPVTGLVGLMAVASASFGLYACWVWAGVLHADDRATLMALARSPRSIRTLLQAS